MVDIASLGFKIDTSDVAKADSALDGLAATGAKTEAAAKGVGNAWTEAGRKTGAAAGQMGSTSSAIRQGNDALRAQQAELGKLLGQINPVVAALDRLDQQEAKLRQFKSSGLVDIDTFREYKAQIDSSRASLAGVDGAIRRTGNTSKQTAQALRQLPAQFSDIAISLQAGQSPLTVFLQQGAQIKDSFGGVGPALRAVGGAALGMINPLTLTAAALAALAFAYKQGSDESTAFKTALILSGNAAGTTSGQLSDLARTIDGTVGTQRQAAKALAEVAGSGKFTAEQLQSVATAAVAMEVATGKAVSDTVSEFKKLADEPAAAAAKLNEQYNFLTASVYAQITALEDQGDAAGAASLAIETFGDAMERRASQIEGNLGLIESAWAGIKNVAAEAWDEMLGIGREQSITDRLEELRTDRVRESFGPRGDRVTPRLSPSRAAEFDAEETRLLVAQQGQGLAAATEGLRAENQKTAIQGLELIGKEAESAQSSVEKLRERLVDLNKAKDFNISNRSFTPEARAQFEKSTAALNKQIADAEERANRPKKTPRAAAFREDAGARMLNNLREQYAQLVAQGEATKRLTSSEQALVKFQQQIADIKNKQVLTADQKSLLASQEMITAQLKRNVAIENEAIARKEIQKSMDDYNKLTDSLLSKEEKQLQLTRDRFEVLEKARKNGLSEEEFDKTSSAIISKSTVEAPKFGGLDPSIGGVGGEIEKIKEAERELEDWYDNQLTMLEANRAARADLTAKWDKQEAEVKQQHEDRLLLIEQARQRATLSIAGEVFGNLAVLAQSENKKLVAIGKAAAIAQATISGFQAIQNALAVPPYPLGVALAVTAGVATAANIASIAGVGFRNGGFTGHGAANEVAGLVHKGEYVMTKEATQRLGVGTLEALSAGRSLAISGASGGPAGALSGAAPITVISNNSFPGITDARESKRATAQQARQAARALQAASRYS